MKKEERDHKIIYINDDGYAPQEKKKFQRVIFIGDNEILKKIKIKKIILPFVFVAFLSSIIYTSSRIYTYNADSALTEKLNENYIDIADIDETADVNNDKIVDSVAEEQQASPNSTDKKKPQSVVNNSYYWKFNNVKMLDVNFNKLLKTNDETVAWLKVPGTDINYPVVQHSDNKYYLRRTFDKSKNEIGWIFLDSRNNGYLTNRNNVIYGHGGRLMGDLMFGTLRNVIKKSWYTDETNRVIKTSTPTHNDLWEVFSVYTIKSESYYIQTGFESNLDYYNFLTTIKDRSIYDFGVTVSFTDKILTLSTCYNNEKRTVLHARLIVQDNKVDESIIPNEEIKVPEENNEENTSSEEIETES